MSQLPNCIASPAWMQLLSWISDPIEFQVRCRQKYGEIFTLNLGRLGYFVLISNPEAIFEVFSQDAKLFNVGSGNTLAIPLLGENSLMLMDGGRHRRERKLLMPPFHGDRVHTYAAQICSLTEQVASQWQVGQSFRARTAMQAISLEVILQVVFGLSQGERYQQLKLLLADWTNMIDSPLSSSMLFFPLLQRDWGAWTPWGQMKQRQRHIHQLLQAEIEERRTKGNKCGADVLSLMMAARDEQGKAMTDEELRDELLTILFAGHETTATILAWAFYQVHKLPDVHAKLLHELASLGENPQPIDIAQLPYLTATCQETLRMYPILPAVFTRIAKAPVSLAGYQFDEGVNLLLSIYLVHYREDLYPEPKQFKPERFLERQYSHNEYFPFGGGSRRCLGYALAELEIKLVLATVLSKYQLTLAEDKHVLLQRRGFTLAPKGGVRLVMSGKRRI